MRDVSRVLVIALLGGLTISQAVGQCPKRPDPGTVLHDALSLTSSGGVLNAELTVKHSVDEGGYTHYCYNYLTDQGKVAEAPTLRLNPGDTLELDVKNRIQDDSADATPMAHHMNSQEASCGDSGTPTIDSQNVHFHGMNIPPTCHKDNVITTLIQPGTNAFHYKFQVPADEPPGLYWYHPHVHGFAEFHVNGGAAGALVVEGMDKIHPEVAGLTERVFVIRQQFLIPWVPGPYQLTINYEPALYPNFPSPMIEMKPGEKQFWRVANATNQDFMPLQVVFNGQPQPLQVVALDGYPLPKLRTQNTILVPPAGRAEFIVQAPNDNTVSADFETRAYDTGPTGNPDIHQILGNIVLTNDAVQEEKRPLEPAQTAADRIKFRGLSELKPTAERKLYFSEEFGGSNGPIQFYITVDGQKQKVFDPNEKPVIVTKVGAVEDWTIENRALETHAFHIHQIHFKVLEIDGKAVQRQDLKDTIEIPFWEGRGHPYHSVKLRMDFRDPVIAGTFLFHCHILLHEDLGMMHKILVKPN